MNRTPHPKFRILYGSVVGLGVAVVGYGLYRVIQDQTPVLWMVLAFLAAVTGSFSLKIPGLNGRVSAGDTITYLNILLFGPYAGVLSAALDAIGGSLRCRTSSRRLQFALYNSGSSALSAFVAGQVSLWLLGKPLWHSPNPVQVAPLLLPLCVLAGGYFLLNTGLVACAVALEKSLRPYDTWRDGFLWTCVNYLAGAFVAGILVQIPNPLSLAMLVMLGFSCAMVYISCRAHVRFALEAQHRLDEHQAAVSASSIVKHAAA
jgi:hypothetical protein